MAKFDPLSMRHVVLAFAHEMEERLTAKENKGGWHNEPIEFFLRRIREETDALEAALKLPRDMDGIRAVTKESADVANFAMMIYDLLGSAPSRVAQVEDQMGNLRHIVMALRTLKERV